MRTTLLLVFFTNFLFAQNADLLNTDWQITKITSELRPDQLPPPMPYQQVTRFSSTTPQLYSSFFNTVSGNLTFGGTDNFTVSNKTCTNAEYSGDNGEVNDFFGTICDIFGRNTPLYYYITNNGNEKKLVISSPIFESIHFKSVNLTTENYEFSTFSISPNPVKDLLTVNHSNGINTAEIFDWSGKRIYTSKNKGAKSLKIDMKMYKTGIYFIRLDNSKSIKFNKE